jgi:hypothetical protein
MVARGFEISDWAPFPVVPDTAGMSEAGLPD